MIIYPLSMKDEYGFRTVSSAWQNICAAYGHNSPVIQRNMDITRELEKFNALYGTHERTGLYLEFSTEEDLVRFRLTWE